MVARTVRGILQVVGGLIAGFAIILVLVGWRLSSGPISLAFVTPYIEKALASQHDRYAFKLSDTILIWEGWDRTLDIRIVGARILDDKGTTLAAIPQLSLSLSAQALVEGVLAPKTIELFSPIMHLVRSKDGDVQLALSKDQTDATMVAIRVLRLLATQPDPEVPMSYLRRITVHHADLTITDENLGSSWRAPDAHADITMTDRGVEGQLVGDVETGAEKTNLSMLGTYDLKAGRIDLGISFSGLTPSRFAGLSAELKSLDSLELPMQGTVTITALDDGEIESVGFDILSTKGLIRLADPIKEDISVERIEFKGRYSGKNAVIDVERVAVVLGADGFVPMPAPSLQKIPLTELSLKARYDPEKDHLAIYDLKMDLRGPMGAGSFDIKDVSTPQPRITGEAGIKDVAVDDLEVYWPDMAGVNARNWAKDHMRDGVLDEAKIELDLSFNRDAGAVDIHNLTGTMQLQGVTVDYLPPMPPVTDTSGAIRFTDNKFLIYIREGQRGDLKVSKGTVFLTDLDTNWEMADIEAQIDGPVRSAMALIDHEPLGFASKVGMAPEAADGQASVHLKMRFPLLNDLTLDQVEVSAMADLSDVSIEKVLLHHDLSDGVLKLDVNKQRINVSGNAKLSNIPAYLTWTENFQDDAAFRRRYDVEARITGVDDLNDLGLYLDPFRGDIVDGVVNTKVRYTEFDDKTSVMVGSAELAEVAISIPEIGWMKEKAQPGHAELEMHLKNKLITAIPKFLVETSNLDVRGAVTYGKDGSGLDAITFDKIGFEKTDVAGQIRARDDGGWAVSISGKSFNLKPLWDEFMHRRDQLSPAEPDQAAGLKAVGMAIDVDRVWLGDDRLLEKVSGRFSREGDIWRTVILKSVMGPDQVPLELRIEPDGYNARRLNVVADDAGLALRTLGIYDNMIGGDLEIRGRFDDQDPKSPLDGRLLVNDFRVVNAPVLAHVVSIMSLTGIVDALRGEGLGFLLLDAPFKLKDSILTLKDARSTGIALGWTASGTFDSEAEMVNLQGTLVPAYAINSALGYIPILGDILTGGEKGGGIFAANYQVKGWIGEPSVDVNTLSALAPGFLRQLFRPSGQNTASNVIIQRNPIQDKTKTTDAAGDIISGDAKKPDEDSENLAPQNLVPDADAKSDQEGHGL